MKERLLGEEPKETKFELDLDYILSRADQSYLFRKACLRYLEDKLIECAVKDESKRQYVYRLMSKDNPDIRQLFGYLTKLGVEVDLLDLWDRNKRSF